MIPLALTKTGIGFLCLSAFLYLASMQEYSGLLFFTLGIIAGCFVYNIAIAIKNAGSLQVTLPETIQGIEGEHLRGECTVFNPTTRMAGYAEILSPWGVIFRIGGIEAGGKMQLSSGLSLNRRGVYPYSVFTLVTSFPFGLIRYRKRFNRQGEIIVYPAVYDCDPPNASGFMPMLGGKFTGKYRTSVGDKFHGVRPMQESDPVKLLHWPSSSKGQGMMVKEFDEELSGSISILIDCRSSNTPDGGNLLDWIARAAGSLSLLALEQGNQLTLANITTEEILSISPFADSDIILEELARVKECDTINLKGCLRRILPRLPKKSSLCFILSRNDKGLIRFIKEYIYSSAREISLYLPDLDETPVPFHGWHVAYYSAYGIRKDD